ncbi:serine/threonine-protein kinase [Actinoplanes siamensis]|uniref:non-specific serine/threonine protein kinase n=1 Tax=Actinoplanes siamensis TaxID=1223317 RepID=A0A919TL20_9ACTN|nr:serine/threonine-protein kinase [Actinoplanes siamensis]GIF06651.1 hypothetical protein Asi03nite_41890 [Actinoplanes siamensis]
MLVPGIVLNGRYQLTQRIAAGGMGEVWRGGDLLLQREIAVKVLLPALMNDREFITRFRSEARMMAQLRHPGIVQVYDYGENAVVDGERFDYLVMEFIEGASLSKKIERAGRLSPAETMSIVAGMADALHAAHQSGIIHRDVKPGNLLVRPGGALVLVDFGIARSVGVTGITSTNVVMGSAHYMAPEQAEGQPVTAATDVYALGAVAYTCLTGRTPYVGDSPLAVLAQLVHGQPPVLPPDVPRPVASVVLRALAKDPAQRFPSGAALADAARNALRAPSGPPQQATGGTWAAPQTVRQAPPPRPASASVPPTGSYGSGPHPVSGSHPASGAYPSTDRFPASGGYPASGAHPVSDRFSASGSFLDSAPEQPADKPARKRGLAIAASAAGLILLGLGIQQAVKPDHSEDPAAAAEGIQQSASAKASPTHKNTKPGVQRTTRPAEPKDPEPDETGADQPDEVDPDAPAPEETEETNKYSPRQVCGGNDYEVVDQINLKSDAGVVKGRIYLLYRQSDQSSCVVTLRTAGLAGKGEAAAYVEAQGSARKTQGGPVQYYAGPVKATGACVKWGGSVGTLAFESEDFEHCE